jgi:mono/diheme cytochrome c family protein
MNRFLNITLVALLALAVAACGNDAPDNDRPANGAAGLAELTAFELEHGIGPINEPVDLGPIDPERAARGAEIFEMSCAACHQMEGRFVGPPLGDVTERRTPAFVMNMILNPEEMARRHPEGQAMLQEYPVIMPYQNITEEQARDILEYLRTQE